MSLRDNLDQHQALLMSDDDNEDEGLGFGEEGTDGKNRLRHPIVALFRLAISVYMFGRLFLNGYVSTFVTVLVLLCLDFWTVKNITGRILVGLRWWNHVDEDGKSQWVFESKKGTRAGGRAPEKKVFWLGLIIPPGLWILLFMSSFFTLQFHWTILTMIALGLNGANLYGYIRCKLGHNPGMSDATGIFQQGISSFVFQRATQPMDEQRIVQSV